MSGVVDWLDGDVVDDGFACVPDDGVVCAATQTADNSRIAVIRYAFLICVLLYFRPALAVAH